MTRGDPLRLKYTTTMITSPMKITQLAAMTAMMTSETVLASSAECEIQNFKKMKDLDIYLTGRERVGR